MLGTASQGTLSGKPWKSRLYDAYVSSGQAAPRPTVAAAHSPAAVFAPFAAQMRHFITSYVPPDRDARIADLGCGDGVFLHFLLEAGYRHVSGIDVSAQQIARAHALGLFEARRGDIDTFLASADDRSLDVILLIDVLEHLTREQLFAVLDGVARVLSSGGVCIVHAPNAEGIYGMRIRYGDLTHEQAFTSRSMAQAFATVGFRTVTAFEERPVVHGLRSLVRRALWEAGTLPHRLLLAAETGTWGSILSQNLVVRAVR